MTANERRVLALLGRGLPNRTIAQTLGITDARVKTHVRSVLAKLRLENRTAAAVFSQRNRGRLPEDGAG
jgi:DNA-binding NarL/FixJ family response regulator